MKVSEDAVERENALVVALRILAARGRVIRERQENQVSVTLDKERKLSDDVTATQPETQGN